MRRTHLLVPALLAAAGLTVTGLQPVAAKAPAAQAAPAAQHPAKQRAKAPPRRATVVGRGGAVTSVDPYASRIGLKVLKQGGNAVDAAVATAAALGVTEPYSSGLGGGGYFVYYDAKRKKVQTLDGRETAPARMKHDAFIDPATGKPYTFTPDLVTSGVSVGVPGTPATWQAALDRWGSMSLADVLKPAAASGPARLQGRQDVQPADRGQRRAVQHLHLDPQAVPAPRQGAEGRQPVPQPAARRRPTTCSPSAASASSTAATWPARSPRRCASHRPAAAPTSRCPRARCGRRTSRLTTSSSTGPPTSTTAAWTSTACPCPPAAARRSARRSTSSSATT